MHNNGLKSYFVIPEHCWRSR